MLYDLIMNDFGKEEDYNCAEKILYGANEVYNLSLPKEALKLSAAFGGGMGIESTCGALTGAVMVLSSMYVEDIAHESKEIKDLTTKLFEEFEKEMESIQCKELKAKYRKEDIGCKNIILAAAKALDKIIGENS